MTITNASGANTNTFSHITGIETLVLGGSTGVTATIADDTYLANLTGTSGADHLTFGNITTISIDAGGAGTDSFISSSSSDSLTFTSNLGASGATASIDGGSGNDTITLKAGGVDYVQITGNTGIDTIDLGSSHTGAISIVIAAGNSSTTTATAVTDVVTHFVAGVDTFALGVAGSSSNYAENETSVDSLATLLTNANTALDGTKLYYFGVTGGNGYLVTDDTNGTGANNIIQLTGITTFADAGAAITS